jgi:hypothetical protein
MWRLYDAFRLHAIVLRADDQSPRAHPWQRLSRYANPKTLAQHLFAKFK